MAAATQVDAGGLLIDVADVAAAAAAAGGKGGFAAAAPFEGIAPVTIDEVSSLGVLSKEPERRENAPRARERERGDGTN